MRLMYSHPKQHLDYKTMDLPIDMIFMDFSLKSIHGRYSHSKNDFPWDFIFHGISSTSCPSCRVAAAPAPQRPATPKWHRWHRHGAGRLRRVTAPAPGRHVLICQNKGSVSAHFYSFVKGIFDIGGKLSVTLQNHMANMIRGKSRK